MAAGPTTAGDTTEAVALQLAQIIHLEEKHLKEPSQSPPRDYWLKLYSECLKAVKVDRPGQ